MLREREIMIALIGCFVPTLVCWGYCLVIEDFRKKDIVGHPKDIAEHPSSGFCCFVLEGIRIGRMQLTKIRKERDQVLNV